MQQESGSRLLAAGRVVGALRSPRYRRYWLGNLAAVSGQQMMWVAQGWLIYRLTDSPLYLGYAGLATAAPAIVLNLVGGVLADRLDQRRVIFATQLVTAASVAGLATLTALDLVQPWHVLAVGFASGATQAFGNPARQSLFPQLIEREQLMNAVALNSMVWQSTRIVAPAAGGVLVGTVGEAATFYLAAASFSLLGFIVIGLRVEREVRGRRETMLRDLAVGLGFIREHFLFAFLIGMSFVNSFFGNASQQLMPVFARDILDAGPSGMGLLMSAGGFGAILGLGVTAALTDYDRKGYLLVGGASAYGAFLVLFALSTSYPLSLFASFFMGAFGSVYMITVQTALQLRVPDELRGRVMGVFGMTYNMGPLGGLQAGAVADAFSAPAAVALSGLAIIAFASSATLRSEVRRLEAASAPALR